MPHCGANSALKLDFAQPCVRNGVNLNVVANERGAAKAKMALKATTQNHRSTNYSGQFQAPTGQQVHPRSTRVQKAKLYPRPAW